jgi:hypothetical protein
MDVKHGPWLRLVKWMRDIVRKLNGSVTGKSVWRMINNQEFREFFKTAILSAFIERITLE